MKRLTTNQETELKLIVDDKGYRTLGEHFSIIKIKEQKNFYFDNGDFSLKEADATLRIRIEGNDTKLTLKTKKGYKDMLLRESMEYEIVLEEKDYFSIINNPASVVDYFSEDMYKAFKCIYQLEKPLELLGSIKNTRTYLHGYQNVIFELDKSILPNDNILYELEVENISLELAKKIIQYLEEIGVTSSINNISKYNRFLNLIYKIEI